MTAITTQLLPTITSSYVIQISKRYYPNLWGHIRVPPVAQSLLILSDLFLKPSREEGYDPILKSTPPVQ
ncbi:hypothetical protein TNCT_76071 [Trichonephila clavata]|uniref:Uncharacterized protein n=1 Tax=Trichonephila clavata TaxID=2740835 RepID=A0A8X6GMN5_TRICU|nr:hypothetical protein TNCT_76071 [Trichonephila clavata]